MIKLFEVSKSIKYIYILTRDNYLSFFCSLTTRGSSKIPRRLKTSWNLLSRNILGFCHCKSTVDLGDSVQFIEIIKHWKSVCCCIPRWWEQMSEMWSLCTNHSLAINKFFFCGFLLRFGVFVSNQNCLPFKWSRSAYVCSLWVIPVIPLVLRRETFKIGVKVLLNSARKMWFYKLSSDQIETSRIFWPDNSSILFHYSKYSNKEHALCSYGKKLNTRALNSFYFYLSQLKNNCFCLEKTSHYLRV